MNREHIWQFFLRTESNRHHPKDAESYAVEFSFPPGTTLATALEYARAHGMPQGTHRTGCFEVQTPDGIHQHIEGNRIDLSTPRKAAKVVFKTWEQLEQEEIVYDRTV